MQRLKGEPARRQGAILDSHLDAHLEAEAREEAAALRSALIARIEAEVNAPKPPVLPVQRSRYEGRWVKLKPTLPGRVGRWVWREPDGTLRSYER